MNAGVLSAAGFLFLLAAAGSHASERTSRPSPPDATTRPASPGPAQTRITFIGSGTAVPGADDDTACFIINGNFQVDCGWNSAINMRKYALDPLKIQTLYITHLHHDHYMGLPGLLFYRGMNRSNPLAKVPLKIVGPADDLPVVVDLSRRFLQADRFPEVWPAVEIKGIEPGQTYETDEYRIQTVKARHPVTALCSRLTDRTSGIVIAFSGDSAPDPDLATLAAGADLLIHEASIGPKTPDDRMGKDHSRAIDAARIARDAGVGRLILIHLPAAQREPSLSAAREIFPSTELAECGRSIVLKK